MFFRELVVRCADGALSGFAFSAVEISSDVLRVSGPPEEMERLAS
jgi:hypothetical protein